MAVKYLILIITILISSCVGTIDSVKPTPSQTVKSSSPAIVYSGITAAIATSHNKVDVFFEQGDLPPEQSKYLIYTNDNQSPMEVNGNRIIPSQVRPGEFKVTIDGLSPNTSYTFSVALMSMETGVISNVNKKERVRTFSNATADFLGLLSADPLEGANGKTQVRLRWIPAVMRGDIFGAHAQDPVLYRIQYIDSEEGTANELINETNPEIQTILIRQSNGIHTKVSTPLMNYDNFYNDVNKVETTVINDLTPGRKYFFNVRVAHFDYINYRTQVNYKYEQNLNVKSVTTLDESVGISWNDLSVTSKIVSEDASLTKRLINWSPAIGPFHHYRVYVRDLNASPSTTLKPDVNGITLAINNNTTMPTNNFGVVVNASNPYVILNALSSYRHYNIQVGVCFDENCSNDASRIISPVHSFQLLPKIAPFFGIRAIVDPSSSATLNSINVAFDPPVINSGYLNGVEVYCMPSFGSNAATDGVLLKYDEESSGSSTAKCNGITRNTPDPVLVTDYANFSNIQLTSSEDNPFLPDGNLISNEEYCFGIVPIIKNGSNVIHRDLQNMVTKCSYIQKRIPTASDFPGALKICNPNPNETLTVGWNKPKAGIYNGYTVFWMKNIGKPFLFTQAMSTAIEMPNTPGFKLEDDVYYKKNITNINTVITDINGLIAGNRYYYGVLAHDDHGGVYNYSEINTNIQDCSIKLPTAKFEEWVDVLAIGPKEHGMSGYENNTGKRYFISEALNDYGQPVELDVDPTNGEVTPSNTSIYGVMRTQFNGVFGKFDNESASSLYPYSNMGIVRIAWKDIGFSSGNTKLNDYIVGTDKTDGEGDPIGKNDRKYGYHVYRSDDNQSTWTKLTGAHDYQEADNVGLLHPERYYEWNRSNAGYDPTSTAEGAVYDDSTSFNAVTFTDYSVSASLKTTKNAPDRARIYYYKVVPVMNGSEVQFSSTGGTPQNIIKVVLPPPSMAYVSRVIANRQTCMELGSATSKDLSTFYTCKYNGLGATSLEKPVSAGSSSLVYDVGNDFLIDRYELGCNVTRGSENIENSTLPVTGGTPESLLSEFEGSFESFSGCAFNQGPTQTATGFVPQNDNYEDFGSGLGQTTDDPDVENKEGFGFFRRGDCIGRSQKVMRASANSEYLDLMYPGFYGDREVASMRHAYMNPYTSGTGTFYDFAAQSEYAAVHHNTSDYRAYNNDILKHAAKGGDESNANRIHTFVNGASACTVNLPAIIGVAPNAVLRPRWIAANRLSELQYNYEVEVSPGDYELRTRTYNVLDKTISWLKTATEDIDPDLIDPGNPDKDENLENYLSGLNIFYDESQTKVPGKVAPTSPPRFDDETKIGRIVSSNASKLPPLSGLTHESAGILCGTYEVEVGYQKDNNWVKTADKQNKRPMRRAEGIIANAWPKMFVEGAANRNLVADGVSAIVPETNNPVIKNRTANASPRLIDLVRIEQGADLQIFTATKSITNPLGGFNASCLAGTTSRVLIRPSEQIVPGSLLVPNYSRLLNFSSAMVHTGSSVFDLGEQDWHSTQNCVSRYGLQDIVGNVAEVSSDEIHCDTQAARDQSKIGLFAINAQTDDSPKVLGENRYYRTDSMIAKGFVEDAAAQEIVGSCAVNSLGNDRDSTSAFGKMFISGTQFFNELINIWGEFTNLIDESFLNKYDVLGVSTLRNGDGYFLDFGRNKNLAPELRHGGELALYNTPSLVAKSSYFSPVIGIPLKCPESVCGREVDTTKSDNLKYKTKTLTTAVGEFSFPIGNSQIQSSGVLAVTSQNSYRINEVPNKYPSSPLEYTIAVREEGGVIIPTTDTINTSFGYPGEDYNVRDAIWKANLDYSFKFYNFGSSADEGAGRYAAQVEALDTRKGGALSAGTRCAITLDN